MTVHKDTTPLPHGIGVVETNYITDLDITEVTITLFGDTFVLTTYQTATASEEAITAQGHLCDDTIIRVNGTHRKEA